MEYPIAILSDIHGNRWALEAVLEDLNKRGIKQIFNLGDSLFGPLDPKGTLELLKLQNVISVSGNEDRIIFDMSIDGKTSPTLNYVRSELDADDIDWLARQPSIFSVDKKFLLFHGTPKNNCEYLIYNVGEKGISYKNENDQLHLLQDYNEKFILCGHDHTPNIIKFSDNSLVINPGSVGLQAYDDDIPFFHKIENGNPYARYTVFYEHKNKFKIVQVTLPYDFEKAAKKAENNNRPDWARWLRTGWA